MCMKNHRGDGSYDRIQNNILSFFLVFIILLLARLEYIFNRIFINNNN